MDKNYKNLFWELINDTGLGWSVTATTQGVLKRLTIYYKSKTLPDIVVYFDPGNVTQHTYETLKYIIDSRS